MKYPEKVVVCALAASLALAAPVFAEPVDPPPGPVAGTGATQIFDIPFTITEPGSYRLARDVVASGGINGITIEADNVTLDLGGHSLNGGGITAGQGFEGIVLSGNRTNVTIRNGRIADWANAGIWDSGTNDTDVVVEDVTITDVGIGGVEFFATQATVRGVVVRNASPTIAVADNSRVIDCRAINSLGNGISAGPNAVITGCVVQGAASAGVNAGANANVSDTTAVGNGTFGFTLGAGSLATNCVASDNGSNGAAMSIEEAFTRVSPRTGEVVSSHPFADLPATVQDPRTGQVVPNPTLEALGQEGVFAQGFSVGASSRIVDCVARGNVGSGFFLGDNTMITGSVADSNGGNGISATGDCVVNHNRQWQSLRRQLSLRQCPRRRPGLGHIRRGHPQPL